jgi:hypothetical protein
MKEWGALMNKLIPELYEIVWSARVFLVYFTLHWQCLYV